MMPKSAHCFTARLRESIANEHDAIEKTPFSVALISGELQRADYALNLSQMYHVHATLEHLASQQPALAPFFSEPMHRSGVIERDLTNLGFERGEFGVLAETRRIVSALQSHANNCPLSLVGAIYVLEGSRMGSLVLARPLAQSLMIDGTPNSGIDYHIEGARETPMRLKLWKSQVDEAGFEPPVQDLIASCAVELMRGLLDLYQATPAHPSRRQVA